MNQDSKATRWAGRKLLDVNGSTIGTVEGVCYRNPMTGPAWLMVNVGAPGSVKVFFPADEVQASGDRLVAPYHMDYIMGAPAVEDEEALSEAEERRLCFRYGLDNPSSSGKSTEGCGLCRRRRRAERAQQ